MMDWHQWEAWLPVWASDTKRWVWAWPWDRKSVWRYTAHCPEWADPDHVCVALYREEKPK